jgi:S-adenosylmethionine-dependent methyltransferase
VGDPFHDLAERYNSTGKILRQIVRHELVDRGIAEHLPGPPARIADVGGGAGQQAIPLSRRGYEVTIIDPSPKMLAEAGQRLAREVAGVRRRVRLVGATGERAHETLGGETFDAVLCDGVLMYLEDPGPMIHALSVLLRPGGVVSVLAKNAMALAMRPALEGRYQDALSSMKAERDRGRLGVICTGDSGRPELKRCGATEYGCSRIISGTGWPVRTCLRYSSWSGRPDRGTPTGGYHG